MSANKHVIIRGNPRRVNAPGTLTTITFTEDQMAKRSVSKAPSPGAIVYLYRCFGSDQRLLYVGISKGVEARLEGHRHHGSPWVPKMISWTAEPFPNRVAAQVAERKAIFQERPAFNIHGASICRRMGTPRRKRHKPRAAVAVDVPLSGPARTHKRLGEALKFCDVTQSLLPRQEAVAPDLCRDLQSWMIC